jgi:hypothetical protein
MLMLLQRILLPLLVLMALPSVAQQSELTRGLERTYTEWRSSLLARNTDAWRTCTTRYRQVLTHNLIVSQKLRYPDAIFELPVVPPDVLQLKLIETEAVGDTAHLIYYGRIDLGVGTGDQPAIPNNLLVLKYFKEGDAWKFDSTKFINLAENPDMRSECESGSPKFIQHPPFNPPGTAPTVPKLCKEPERVAALRIQAYGYDVLPTVNGFDGTPIIDKAEQQVIIGGLRLGPNELKLTVKELPIPEGDERFLEVEAVLLTPEAKVPTVRVFDWIPTTLPVPAEVKLRIDLNNTSLKGIKAIPVQ